uniref:Uncharacterized protein n=1 Tax=Arundo donax TaxID=35708 RepID=A0A0A8YK05_ARUDO
MNRARDHYLHNTDVTMLHTRFIDCSRSYLLLSSTSSLVFLHRSFGCFRVLSRRGPGQHRLLPDRIHLSYS